MPVGDNGCVEYANCDDGCLVVWCPTDLEPSPTRLLRCRNLGLLLKILICLFEGRMGTWAGQYKDVYSSKPRFNDALRSMTLTGRNVDSTRCPEMSAWR